MRKMGPYGKVRVACVLLGIALMSGVGGATFAHTHDMTATTLALLASAVALTLFGRRTLRWWWGEMMLGLDNAYSEPSAEYEGTSRARKLAPKLVRMVERAVGPVTVIVTGVEQHPKDGTPDGWGAALRTAAHAGAAIHHYLPPGTTEEEAAVAQALADEYRQCRCSEMVPTRHAAVEVYYPTLAWEGDVKEPRQALLWLEDAREPEDTETSVEFRDTRNLRRNQGMLEEFVRSVQRTTWRTSDEKVDPSAAR